MAKRLPALIVPEKKKNPSSESQNMIQLQKKQSKMGDPQTKQAPFSTFPSFSMLIFPSFHRIIPQLSFLPPRQFNPITPGPRYSHHCPSLSLQPPSFFQPPSSLRPPSFLPPPIYISNPKMTTLHNHPILSLYPPIDPVWGDIAQLIKPPPTVPPTLSSTPDLTPFHFLNTQHDTTAITNAPSSDNTQIDKQLKESWNKGREYGLQEGALKAAKNKAAVLTGMKLFFGVVVDSAPVVEEGGDKGGVETEKSSGMEMVIWTPDTSNKDTDDEEGTEEGDLLDFEEMGGNNVEGGLGMAETTDSLSDEQVPVTMEQSNSLNATTAPIDALYERFGIPSLFNTQPVAPNFYSTRTIPPYPFDGDAEQPDVLLLGPLSEPTFEEWKHDHGRGYIMAKAMGVFSTTLIHKNPDETYVRVEFHSRRTRDDALRVFGGVVDEKEGPLFLKGGYPW
ncbi:uncharacterized protein PODANS_0_430 [Podospora anserina S mat+]|uniref:Podospora anserina S mat+ genomic DNA chromosome 4, supercontig 2 n=1 Tax=Podospora anserina (strain S / ATCC MYA-4624 / DSM 980 / FGSC 10383) TaxID=515849 RepID=B2ADX6_PODAN|nr:uncharacterized protein PODANS_0_430 [Podospora anserina S mat+]CAP61641.1 unnamed protein product [Podospora anserina S mat+]CDP27994.1 Putative protein of unknown function [Podospora anserina S mat+]